MVDRNDRWPDDRHRNDHAARRPGGDRDFYGRDERSEDDYGRGFGEEGVTNYRAREPRMHQSGSGPSGYGDRSSGYGDRSSGSYLGSDQAGAYGAGSGRSGGAMPYGGGSQRDDDDRSFNRFSADSGFGGGRQYGYGQTESRSDYRGADVYGRGPERSGHDSRGSERGFWDRATDEVSSWFGDDDAERRRRQDARHQGVGPKGYRRSDERMREDISDRLTDDPYIDASNIEITVEASEVTLSGTVDSRNARRRAEDLIERISGVTHVQNNLRVTSGAETTREERQAQAERPGLFNSSKS